MSGLDRLRTTLVEHAEGVEDTALTTRADSVRRRVAAARRRRRALAAGGVVAASGAVAAVLVGTSLLPSAPPDPAAARVLAGAEAPATLTSLGSTYAFAGGVEGDDEVRVALSDYDRPVLVSWATAGDDDAVELASRGRAAELERTSDFAGFRLVADPADAQPLLVRGEGRVAAAVYTLTDQPPAGVSADGSTWRRQVADSRLVAGEIGGAGQQDVRLRVPAAADGAAAGRLEWYSACTGVPGGYQVVAEVVSPAGGGGGGGALFTCQGDALAADLATTAASVQPLPRAAAAGTAQVSLRVERADGRRVTGAAAADLSQVRLALAVYEASPPAARLAGYTVPEVVEQDGHRWGYVEGVEGPEGADSTGDRVSAQAPAQDGPVLVKAYHGATGAPVRLLRDDDTVVTGSGVGGGGSFGGVVESAPGHTWALVSSGARADLGLAFFERLD